MYTNKRVFIIVMDSFGIGAMPDANRWGDEGSNTLGAIRNLPEFDCPTLHSLGLFNIEGVGGGTARPKASYARLAELSNGKDTTTGHWEIAGLISEQPFPTFPNGFPREVIEAFERATGRKTLCNKPYSGTEVIKDFGKESMDTGALIVYTSADSVFQIAAHEVVVPLEELYACCEVARRILNPYGVGRVIARPFVGEYPFTRTANRHDYSLEPPKETMLDRIKAAGKSVISVGKIFDIFAGRGITTSYRTTSNENGMDITRKLLEKPFEGLCFVNLVDFDSAFGHRNDAHGYARAATAFDKQLSLFLPGMLERDILIITADHGCDPSTPSTDHSREFTPMLICGEKVKNVDLGTRNGFSDISATVLDYLGIDKGETKGTSFLKEVLE